MTNRDGFIEPPPGLLPGKPAGDASGREVSAPRRREQTAKFPAFFPESPGRGVPAPTHSNHGVASESPSRKPAGQASWLLVDAGGATIPVATETILGRNPSRPIAESAAVLVAIDDPRRSLSKTHALLTPNMEGLLVTDLHSTNGVTVTSADGTQRAAVPGQPTLVRADDILTLGRMELRVRQS